jgi:porin
MTGKRGHLPACGRLLGTVGLFALVVAGANTAHAQSSAPAVNIAPVQQFGEAMAQDGITFNSRYLGEFAANPSGGARQGADFTGELNLGADVDLNKLAGVQGGALHVLFTDRAGNNLASKAINNSVSVQQIYGGGQTYQLTILTYEQQLLNKMVDVEFGRTDMPDDFIVSPFYCDFQSNAACGNPSILGKDTGTQFYPQAVWGGRIKIDPTPNVYVKTGIYQSVPSVPSDAGHGFNWGTANSNGFLFPVEVGYTNTTPGAAEPNQYDAGVIFDRSHFSAPYYSTTSPELYGRTLIYLQAQQMLYQVAPDSPRGLYGFAVGLFGASGGRQPANFSAEGGLVFQGPLANRPLDTLGFLVNDVHYNNRYLNSYYQQRVAAGGTQSPANNLVMFELNYAAQVTPWLNVMPNMQYIINPDGLGGLSYPTSNEKNAFVLGLQFVVNVANLFGLPAAGS